MSQVVKLQKICVQCGGTGIAPTQTLGVPGPGIDPCPWPGCDGDGYIEYGKIDLGVDLVDLQVKIDDILDKINDIKEKLDNH